MFLLQTVDQALAGVVLPAGAGTLTIGPQAMEGNLQIHPGDTIKAGYDFTMPGAHAAAQVTVDNASITMNLTCANGGSPILTFPLPVQTFSDPAGSSNWYPSGDQSSSTVYQGSVAAPDLCAGSAMSDPNGATFKATIFSTDTTDKVSFRFHYSDNTAGSWSATVTASPTATAKTVLTATLTPSLGLTLAVDKSSAIPGDTLTYTGTVTNTGATLTIGGDFTASATGASTATVKSYWDDIETSLDSNTWTALAGTAAAQAGYTPAVTPPISSGMTLTATPASAGGVTYPTSGDSLLGTTMTSGSSGLWHYSASVSLTPSQATTLLDPTKTKAIRNSFHLEVSPTNPNITQPSVINVDFSGIFFAASPAPSGAVTNISIAVQPPSGSAITITSTTVPALSSLVSGASANYSASYRVPVPAAKGTSETDSAYQARLATVEGSSLTATASASGSSTGGGVNASAPGVSTTQHLPILSISKAGPSTAMAGTTATYPLTLKNTGGAPASGLMVADTVPSGASGTISGTPTTLAPGGTSTGVQAAFAIPGTQAPGNLTDTATVSWQDANSNTYGPVSNSFTTVVQNQLFGARLTLGLAAGDAGLVPINGTQGLQVTLVNSSGAPIPNQTVTINATGANPTSLSVVTDSNGNASASYAGPASGVAQLQATATSGSTTISSNTVSVTWINPIEPVATTPVQGNFFAEDPSQTTFVAKPGDTAAFQQSFPTINFNPPANTVPHNVAGVGPTTTPFTDVTTDAVGNFAGTIVAQGNGAQAGVGSLSSFDAALTANFVVSQPQDVTFKVFADEGFVLGVGGGATRNSGPLVNQPTSGLTSFNGYPVLASYNTSGATAPATYTVQLHFPTAGAYPYELDYFACCNAQMSLTMTVVSVNAGPYNLFTGYADTVRPAGNSTFPFPWNGSANTTFIGDGSPYDTGGLRFENNTGQPITLAHVTVDIGSHHYDPWPLNLTLPASGRMILAGAGNPSSFDTSEAVGTKAGSGGGSSGFSASQFATGFNNCCGGIGPVGVAFDSAGNLFVTDYADGVLYKFGAAGGVAGPSTKLSPDRLVPGSASTGLAFSKDGKHLFAAIQGASTVIEVDQGTGAVLRTLANIGAATGIATDPISGDLFVTQGGGSAVYRISNPTSASPTVSVYIGRGADGIAFAPDGTMYLASGGVAVVAGTNATSPGSLITLIQNPTALAGMDGIALMPPPPGDTGESIAVNSNNGFIVEIDNPLTANPIFHNIVTGGSRGDFVTVGPDGCLYATQSSSVEKVTASDGSCPFVPSICLPNQTVPVVHVSLNGAVFNYNDPGLALTTGGIDGECNGGNESQAWQQIDQGKAGPINIPLPPAMTLTLQATPAAGHVVGQSQSFTVAAMDGSGQSVPNVGVQLAIAGANPQTVSATTDTNGTATFSYTGANAGTDTIGATAFVSGLRTTSNAVTVQWTIPAPGGPTGSTLGPAPPSVTVTAPADGSQVSSAVAVTASIFPPASSSLASWSVTYQNVAGGAPTTLNSGTGAPPSTLAAFDPTSLPAGTYAIVVNASTSASGGASAVTHVIVGGAAGSGTTGQAPPSIGAPSPADGSIVTKPVPITAAITAPAGQSITSWRVSYQAQDVEPTVTLASGTGSPPATLATFDPTLLPNDTYVITVTATASGGGSQTATTTVAVYGNLKLGRYVTTFQDLSVPVNGFQMEVRRVYDSIDKRVGDFGIGWHVDLANFRVSANRVLGAGGWTLYPTQCIFGLCFYGLKTSTPHYVTVTFPDQHQEIFDFTPSAGAGLLYWQGSAAFTPRAGTGTTSTLEVAGDSGVSYDFAGNLTGANGYYNPTRFKLTTHDGRVLILDTVLGLVSETDRNGNSLSIDSSGVHASNGQSIAYSRDGSGRITQITGPSNQTLTYSYSAGGDLASSSDPDNNTATYTYDASHDLLTVNGPGQTRPLNTLTYDSAGRLVSVTDGNGNTTQISNNVAGQQQTVTDATGKLTTVYTLDALGDVLRQDQVFDGKTLSSTASYDAVGRPLTRTDPLGHTWSGAYDANGNLLNLSTPQSHAVGLTYDSFGAPLSFTDPVGKTTTYGYDGNGNLTTFTNALGQSDRYGYDAQGHATSHTDALGNKWSYTFDAAGHETSITDPLGNVTKYSYDSSGNLTSTTEPTGAVTTNVYDAAGNLNSIKDALGQLTTLTYDALGRLATRTDAAGNKTTYAYDGTNALTSTTDPLGRVTKYSYDADGRLVSTTDPASGVTTYTYDGSGRLLSQKDAIGRVTSYAYDDAGRLTSKTMPNGGSYTYAYNADGYQTSVTDPLGHSTSTTYDANGRATSTSDALGNVTTFSLDALGRVTQTTDPLGESTSQAYDPTGRLSSSTDPLANKTTYSYDGAGNRISMTDPLGDTTSYAYDPAGRLIKTTDPLNRATTMSYDALGRLTSTTLPSGITTTYGYDQLGHETSLKDPLGNTSSYSYDVAGQRISATDPKGNLTQYAYDPAGRMNTITDALGGKVTLSYDLAGQQTSIVNPRGDTTSFTYDPLGNVAMQTDPASKVTTYSYDAAGRLASKTDARGIVVTSSYDANNDLTSTTFPGGSISYAYDAAGRRMSMTDPTGTTTFGYDAASNVTAVAAPQGTVSYTYDGAGRRTSMTLPGPRKVSYSYDAANEMASVTDWFGQTTSLAYNADGLLTNMNRPAGLTTTYGYDGAGRLTSVNNDGPGGALKHFSYTLDANGNRTSMTSAAGTESYSLDALNRITQATYPNGDKVSYAYDAAGNRTSETVNGVTTSYGYDSGGRLVQVGATSYAYDADGNLIGAGADNFSWDWAGRLTQTTVSGITSSYTYDGDNVRVSSQTGSAGANYLWDRQEAVPLLVDDGSHGYIQSAGQGPIEQLDSGGIQTAQYPASDALGSVRGLVNSSGGLTGSTDYDVFGRVRSTNGSASTFGFTGQQADSNSLLYLRARFYSPGLGRFVSSDVVQPDGPGTQGFNRYSYALNNPTSFIDPTGLEGVTGIATIEGTVSTRPIPAMHLVGLEIYFTFLLVTVALTAPLIIALVPPLTWNPGASGSTGSTTTSGGAASVAEGYLTGLTAKISIGTVGGTLSLTDIIARARARSNQSLSVAVDADSLIAGLQEGQYADLEAALAGRQPVVSPVAFAQATVRTGPAPLEAWMTDHQARQGAAANDAEAAALVSLAPLLKPARALGDADAKIAVSAMKEFLPLIARDHQLVGFLKAIGYPVQSFPEPTPAS